MPAQQGIPCCAGMAGVIYFHRIPIHVDVVTLWLIRPNPYLLGRREGFFVSVTAGAPPKNDLNHLADTEFAFRSCSMGVVECGLAVVHRSDSAAMCSLESTDMPMPLFLTCRVFPAVLLFSGYPYYVLLTNSLIPGNTLSCNTYCKQAFFDGVAFCRMIINRHVRYCRS